MSEAARSTAKEMLAYRDILDLVGAKEGVEAPSYGGFDAYHCPSAEEIEIYWKAGFRVACVYLANQPGRIGGGRNRSWISAAPRLKSEGWGLAPTYVGAQASKGGVWNPSDPLKDATTDAAEAVEFAKEAGLVKGQTIYLDVEAPFAVGSNQEKYVLRWIEGIVEKDFKAAMYSFPAMIRWTTQQGIKIWTVHLNSKTGHKDHATGVITWTQVAAPLPDDPIDVGAVGTQGRFYCRVAGLTNSIDYDRWRVLDPSSM